MIQNSKGLVFDCFTFFNELDLLEIRLNILNPIVDKFVLVEATRTQNNEQKPLFYKKNKERYKKFNNKIIHIVVDKFPKKITHQFTIENYQRNCIMKGLRKCNNNDIIMISDLDEILDPKVITKHLHKFKFGTILAPNLFMFYLYLNLWHPKSLWFNRVKILHYKDLKNILDNKDFEHKCIDLSINKGTTPSKIRLYEGSEQKYIKNAGWHFSWLGNKDKMFKKLQSVCEGNKKATMEDAIKHREALLPKLKPVFINKFFPKYLIQNQGTYKHFIIKPKHKYFPYVLIFYKLRQKIYTSILHFSCWFIPNKKLRKKLRQTKYKL